MAKGRSRGWSARPAILAVIRGFSMDVSASIAERRPAGIVPATVRPASLRLEHALQNGAHAACDSRSECGIQCRKAGRGERGRGLAYDGDRGEPPTHDRRHRPHRFAPGHPARGGLFVLSGRAPGAEDRLARRPERLQRSAADAEPRQRLLRRRLPALDQGDGISPEPGRAERPDHHGLHAWSRRARRKRRSDRAHQYPDLRQHHLGWRDAHRGTGGRRAGRPLVRQCHDHPVSRRRNPRPDPAARKKAPAIRRRAPSELNRT